MASDNGVTVRYVRSNELDDIFYVFGNGYGEYFFSPRSNHNSPEDILNLYL